MAFRASCLVLLWVNVVLGLNTFDSNSLTVRDEQNTSCVNGPTSRNCWTPGYNIDTNYYDKYPNTGVVREYWFNVQNVTIAPDGYLITALTINGTIPGPTLEANWGDTFRIHITNQLPVNGTAIHFHGIRQLYTNQYDGVGGVTQCPTAPGSTDTYEFMASQYESSWYHSHFTVQYGAGLWGPIVIHGPATANYDVDLGALSISDWLHISPFAVLVGQADAARFPIISGGLMNGTNKNNLNASNLPCQDSDPACLGTGKRFETTVKPGLKYRIRLFNPSVQTYFRFTIDDHNFTVIANDFVPVEPRVESSLVIGEGQRFDIIVDADQPIGNYWMRAIFQDCFPLPADEQKILLGILRYEGSNETSDPTTTNTLDNDVACNSTDYLDTLTPYLSYQVGGPALEEIIALGNKYIYLWTMNGSSMLLDWEHPTALDLFDGQNVSMYADANDTRYQDEPPRYNLPDIYNGSVLTSRNIWHVPQVNEWVYFIINNVAPQNDTHPMHLHGHDYWILSQGPGLFDPGVTPLNLNNPPRRDVASLFPNGHLVMAFYTDNPGIWLMHCHIAWHVSEGLAVQFMERESEIRALYNGSLLNESCKAWNNFNKQPPLWGQDDSGV